MDAARARQVPSPELERNILERIRQARPEELASGLSWYSAARDSLRALAASAGHSYVTAAGVTAALSPGVEWGLNLKQAGELLQTGDIRRYGGYKAQLEKAKLIAEGHYSPLRLLKGRKERAFFILLVSDSPYAVCLDRHALRAAMRQTDLEHNKVFDSPTQYRRLGDAYRSVAARRRLLPCQVQAIVWVVQKRVSEEEEDRTPW